MAGALRKTIGIVVGYRLQHDELILRVALSAAVDAAEFGRDAWIGDFRYGSPLGTNIEPRFEGRRDGGFVNRSVFDKEAAWERGVFDSNAPWFVGKTLTLPL